MSDSNDQAEQIKEKQEPSGIVDGVKSAARELVDKAKDSLDVITDNRARPTGVTDDFPQVNLFGGDDQHSSKGAEPLADATAAVKWPWPFGDDADKSDKSDKKSDTKADDSGEPLVARPGIKLKVENLLGAEDRKKEHEHLENVIKDKLKDKPEELKKFEDDIQKFEKRAAEGTPPLSNKEVAETYKQVATLIEAKDDPRVPLTADDRMRIAEQVMHHAADPTSIDQGKNPTCNVATVEARTYAREPSKAAKMVVDVATTGEYKTADGVPVKVDPGSLKEDPKIDPVLLEKNPEFKKLVDDAPRDQASKIFQVTAVDAVWATHPLEVGGKKYPPGTVEYRHTDPVTGENSGGALYDKTKTPPEIIKDAKGDEIREPHVNMDQMTDLSNIVTRRDKDSAETDVVLEAAGPRASEKTVKIESEADLRKKLEVMKESGQLPVIISVNQFNSPFWGEGRFKSGSLGSEKDGDHVVTITDYDPKTGMVSMDNQFGQGRDHTGGSAISIGDMYLATLPPGDQKTIETLERDVQWNRRNETVDTFKELELLRQKHEAGKLSDENFKQEADKVMADAKERWDKQSHTNLLNPIEKQHGEEQYDKIVQSLEARQKAKSRGR